MNVRYIINMLGKLLFIEALFLLAPLGVALWYREGLTYTVIPFAATILALILIGGLCMIPRPKSTVIRAREGLLIAGLAWTPSIMQRKCADI